MNICAKNQNENCRSKLTSLFAKEASLEIQFKKIEKDLLEVKKQIELLKSSYFATRNSPVDFFEYRDIKL